MNYYVLSIGTILLLIFSWFVSVKHNRKHGITRFFAFESIFILGLLNYRIWFFNPLSLFQIISWICLILSAYAAITGYFLLKRKGKPSSNFENTSVLVNSGIYKYIRHPMYLSLFLLGAGITIKDPQPFQLALNSVNLVAVCLTAQIEENEMITKFGDDYRSYMNKNKMFVPYLI